MGGLNALQEMASQDDEFLENAYQVDDNESFHEYVLDLQREGAGDDDQFAEDVIPSTLKGFMIDMVKVALLLPVKKRLVKQESKLTLETVVEIAAVYSKAQAQAGNDGRDEW
ncbi:hypothetical protein NDU88_008796 [Pleurodeles waltl]|uniref:Uncharacterized protein n=1 Tax=Pleurodeles waltl TaxID=8319 RepID=A0AAV7PVE3_PLEWA|nr:hypothetical protein NDU88_008796 [Pleurodeles waltl]